jgi:hypothetical protein
LIGIARNSLNTTVRAWDLVLVAAVLVETVPGLLVVFAIGASPSPSRLRWLVYVYGSHAMISYLFSGHHEVHNLTRSILLVGKAMS